MRTSSQSEVRYTYVTGQEICNQKALGTSHRYASVSKADYYPKNEGIVQNRDFDGGFGQIKNTENYSSNNNRGISLDIGHQNHQGEEEFDRKPISLRHQNYRVFGENYRPLVSEERLATVSRERKQSSFDDHKPSNHLSDSGISKKNPVTSYNISLLPLLVAK